MGCLLLSSAAAERLTSMSADIEAIRGWISNVSCCQEQKKADVVEHPKVFGHVGLLFNKPPGKAELLFIQSSDQHS
jgi:hypothetical protein